MGYIENRNSSTFNIVEICNQDCPFCSGYPKIPINIEALKTKIKGLKEISLQWGEPTLSPFLFELLEYARFNGTTFINLITNGLRIGEDFEFAKGLAGNIDAYHFAFMSHKKERADELGKSNDTLKLKTKGVLNLIRLGEWHKIRLVHIIQQKNLNDLLSFILFVKDNFPEIGMIEFKYIQYFGNKNNLWNIPKYHASKEIINKALHLCEAFWIHFLINGIPLCFLEERFHTHTASYYNQNSVQEMENFATVKLKKCENCLFSPHCIGVRKDYIMLQSDKEFLAS